MAGATISEVIGALADVIEQKISYRPRSVDEKIEIESMMIFEIVLAVEERTGLRFDGENYDYESGYYLRTLADGFK